MEIDNTDMLSKILQAKELTDLMLQRLDENATTPAKRETYEMIKTVIDYQSEIIRRLMELNLEVTDQLVKLVNTIEETTSS